MSLSVGELTAFLRLDDGDFNSKTDAAGKKFTGLGSTIGKVASAAAGAMILGKVASVVGEMSDAAIEDEQSAATLANTLKNVNLDN